MPHEFISVSEAKTLIFEHTGRLDPVLLSLQDASGLVISDNIFSEIDLPPFNQSSMDGYALNFSDWKKTESLRVKGTVPAGSASIQKLEPRHAARIFTGAPVPENADTVVMQEKVSLAGDELFINDPNLFQGMNFRPKGSEIRAGQLAMEKNSVLTPAATGYLAGLGISEVPVYPKPTVSIILTGDELRSPGEPLSSGQVYEANSFTLRAALKQQGIENISMFICRDQLDDLINVLDKALKTSDIILLTGGVSVGDYDFVIRAAEANGLEQVFHKIRQKPGKPLYFGRKDRKIIFGLPGNPASVLTCFYEYVLDALNKISGRDSSLRVIRVPLRTPVKKPAGLSQFLKGHYDGLSVSDLKARESFRLSSFATANCLIVLEEQKTEFKEDELVEIHILP